jgi:hypothetical protein
MKVLLSEFAFLRSSETSFTALTSSQLSISSKIITFGFKSFICKTSIFLFSHQLKPTFRSLRRKSFSIQSSSTSGSMIFLKPINEVGFSSLTS